MKTMEYVNTHAPFLKLGSTLRDAVDKMDIYQVTTLPAVDEEGDYTGLITEKQVFEILTSSLEEIEKPAELFLQFRETFIEEDRDIMDALALMRLHQLDCLPVTNQGKLIGTIRLVDICQSMLEKTENPT
jgi:acetoin utilization protein AcuB